MDVIGICLKFFRNGFRNKGLLVQVIVNKPPKKGKYIIP